jgi:hypothetical protein
MSDDSLPQSEFILYQIKEEMQRAATCKDYLQVQPESEVKP